MRAHANDTLCAHLMVCLSRAGCVVALLLAGACREEEVHVEPALSVRPVRVLLFDDHGGFRVRVDGPYTVRTEAGDALLQGDALAWTTVTAGESLDIEPARYGAIRFRPVGGDDGEERRYFGALSVSVQPDRAVRVINLVDVESYVAGVVPNEAWPNFHDEALKAQAVVARTYLLYQMSVRAGRDYDVRASEGDQVYRGVRSDRFGGRVARAVDATRGVVVAWNAPGRGLRIFPTYYSAACGGMTQSAAAIQHEDEPVPTPLRGGVICDDCKIAPGETYRWGPAVIAKSELLQRLKDRESQVADWRRITTVTVTRRNDAGRIAEVRIGGPADQHITMAGERFRLAVGSRLMRSTHCQLTDAGSKLRFTDGHGFGHGVGLCQWGMEAKARAGQSASSIIHHYYPGARLVRAY
jgi:stage II sporulation protein D